MTAMEPQEPQGPLSAAELAQLHALALRAAEHSERPAGARTMLEAAYLATLMAVEPGGYGTMVSIREALAEVRAELQRRQARPEAADDVGDDPAET